MGTTIPTKPVEFKHKKPMSKDKQTSIDKRP